MRASVKIALGERHLRTLIRGGELTVWRQGVKVSMILSDIGFDLIQKCLDDAKEGRLTYVGWEDKQ